MERFSHLLDRLLYAPQRTVKLKLMADYFTHAPDPDRGIALAALSGVLQLKSAKPGLIRQLGMQRVDPELFGWSYDFVGDLAETVALIWPERPTNRSSPRLGDIPYRLADLKSSEAGEQLESWLDTLDATGRWALLKLVTGGLRVGVSARLAKTALGKAFGVSADDIEEIWHGLEPPYRPLFAWLEGRAPRPDMSNRAVFRPRCWRTLWRSASAESCFWRIMRLNGSGTGSGFNLQPGPVSGVFIPVLATIFPKPFQILLNL